MKKITLCLMLILTLMLPGVVQATDVTTENVAQIGETEYATIAEAIEAVPTDGTETTITLLKNVEKGTGFKTVSGQNIVIDFAGFKYDAAEPLVGSTGTVTNGCQLKKGSTVTLKNGTLVTTSEESYILIQNYSNLTLEDMTIDATQSTSDYAISNNNGKVNISGNTSIVGNKYAFDMCWAPNKSYPDGTQITVNTTGTIIGDIELGVWGKYSDTDGIKSTLTIENINHVGNVVISDSRLANQLTIKGGTFTSDVSEFVPEYYVCNPSGSNYVVKKLYDIEVKYSEGGTASSDLIRAVEGTKIGLFITPETGYELKEIIITDALGVQTKTTNNYFIMPNSDVKVDVVFDEIKQQEVEIPNVVEDVEKVEDILLESLKQNPTFQEVIKNNNVEVKVELSEEKVQDAEKEQIKEKLEKEGLTVGKCFDITIAVINKDTGTTEGTLDVLTEKIKFTIEIPEDLPEIAEGLTRKYYIIRNHDGEVEYLQAELSEDGKSLSFETDKFSTYVLAYADVEIANDDTVADDNSGETAQQPEENEKDDTPKTGMINISTFIWLAVAAIALTAIANTKKSSKHSK